MDASEIPSEQVSVLTPDSLRERADSACPCDDPECGMMFRSLCHADAGTRLKYFRRSHALQIDCHACGKNVLQIRFDEGWATTEPVVQNHASMPHPRTIEKPWFCRFIVLNWIVMFWHAFMYARDCDTTKTRGTLAHLGFAKEVADSVAGISISFLFEPRNVFIGIYWDRKNDGLFLHLVYFPMLTVRVLVIGSGE